MNCAPGFLPLFLVPHLHTFPIASCKCKGQTEKGKSHITGCLSNLVLHYACFKWEHRKRCAVSSLELLTLLFSLERNPTSHAPLFLWHPLCKQRVRKRQTKRLQERMKSVYKCLFFNTPSLPPPVTSETSAWFLSSKILTKGRPMSLPFNLSAWPVQ